MQHTNMSFTKPIMGQTTKVIIAPDRRQHKSTRFHIQIVVRQRELRNKPMHRDKKKRKELDADTKPHQRTGLPTKQAIIRSETTQTIWIFRYKELSRKTNYGTERVSESTQARYINKSSTRQCQWGNIANTDDWNAKEVKDQTKQLLWTTKTKQATRISREK